MRGTSVQVTPSVSDPLIFFSCRAGGKIFFFCLCACVSPVPRLQDKHGSTMTTASSMLSPGGKWISTAWLREPPSALATRTRYAASAPG